MTGDRFIAAALQMCAKGDISSNLALCKQLAVQAYGRGASLLVLPEGFACLGLPDHERLTIAEHLQPDSSGPILGAGRDIAREHDVWVIAGGIPEIADAPTANAPTGRSNDPPRHTYHSCVTVSPDGQLVAVYRKLHVIGLIEANDAESSIHRSVPTAHTGDVQAGRDIVVSATDLGRIGLSLGDDLRFPELYRELVIRLQSQILAIPAALAPDLGARHWHSLVRARAIENQCYVIAAAQVGRHDDQRASYGHSMIVDPLGEILAEVDQGEGIATAEIDLHRVADTRRRAPYLRHTVLLA